MEHSSVPAAVGRLVFVFKLFQYLYWRPNAYGVEKILISFLRAHAVQYLEIGPLFFLVPPSASFRSLSRSQPERR